MAYKPGTGLRLLSQKGGNMSEARRYRRNVSRNTATSAPKSKFKQLEEVLLNGTPQDMYALIPPRQRKAFEMFARGFGIKKEDIERIISPKR